MKQYECMYFIVQHGLASWILRFARDHGVFGGTIFYGQGTVRNFWLELLSLNHTEKEILMMVAEQGYAHNLMALLYDELQMWKHNHGISFSVPVNKFIGGKHDSDVQENAEENDMIYDLITVIVDKGKAEEAMEAAQEAGAAGGTIINARGAGKNETSKFCLMDIEPEKEILMLVTEKEKTEAIAENINKMMDLEGHGKGIMMVQEISKAYGLYDPNAKC
ncbi:MAG: P-II family nitrogen regulator [Bacillota bacterium]|nr:P-II family nitrogen regulator [Bacillota bacterium]